MISRFALTISDKRKKFYIPPKLFVHNGNFYGVDYIIELDIFFRVILLTVFSKDFIKELRELSKEE